MNCLPFHPLSSHAASNTLTASSLPATRTSMKISYNLYLASFVVLCFFHKLIKWVLRIRKFRQSMPVIPTLFPPESLFRRLIPRKYQRYHFDWHLHLKGYPYNHFNSDVVAFVCFFEHDVIAVRDPEVFVHVKITDFEQFPKGKSLLFKMVLL